MSNPAPTLRRAKLAGSPLRVVDEPAPPASTSFTSAMPYEAERIFAAAIYCSDGRLGDHMDDFLHKGLGLPRYDRLACPGGPVALAGRFGAYWEDRGMEEQLRFLANVHEIRQVVLIAHTGCAYYAHRLAIPADQIEREQKEDLQRAAWAVRRIRHSIEVTQYVARVSGRIVTFEPV